MIIVSQRISTVADADQIVVIDDGRVVGAGTHATLLACAHTRSSPTPSRLGAAVAVMTGAAGATDPRQVQAPTIAPATSRLRRSGCSNSSPPSAALAVAVILLGVGGIAISMIGPRILGHATDLLFNGVIGHQLPAGLTKQQAVAAARARGDNTFADLLSGMNVVPGQGVDFAAIGRTLLLALGTVSGCRADDLAAGPAAQRRGPAHDGGASLRRRGQSAPDAAVLLRLPPAR